MTSKTCALALFIGASILVTSPASAQSADEKKAISESLKQRLEPVSGTIIDPQNAGYYQLVLKNEGFARDALCPSSKKERDDLLKMGTDIFNWALKKKKNWGATVGIVYNRSAVDFDDTNFKADAEVKLFTVEQSGGDPGECTSTMTNTGTLYSPLLPIEAGINPAPAQIELITWYNNKADQGRIDAIPKLAGSLFGAIGLPATLLSTAAAAVGASPSEEIKRLINSERTSKARTRLYPRQAADMGAIAYLGLREPDEAVPLTMKAKTTFSFQAVSSIFSNAEPSFVSLAHLTPDNILYWNLNGEGTPRYLSDELGKSADYGQMLSSTTYDVLSSRCDSLFLYLRNNLKISTVDSAVIVHAVVAKHPSLKIMANVNCLVSRANLLAKVSIAIPPAPQPLDLVETGAPAKQTRMKDVMDSFASLRANDPEYVSGIQWSAFRFPLTVYDAADKFGWDNQRREFTAANRSELHQLLRERVEKVGCWAYFENVPITFATGMGDVGEGDSPPVRKSAALALSPDKSVSVIQFRYGGGGDGALVTGLALVSRDAEARTKMLSNENCNAGKPDREWMQVFLRPSSAGGGTPP